MSNLPVSTEEIKDLVRRMYEEDGSVAAAEIFMSAADLEEVMRFGLMRAELEIMANLKDVIKALVKQAKEGDTKASQLLFEAAGLINRKGASSSVNVNQINLSPQDIERIVRGIDGIEVDYEIERRGDSAENS